MTEYWMVRQGRGGAFVDEMVRAGHVGVDFLGDYDIRRHLGNGYRTFHAALNDVYLRMHPDKSRITAGLAVGNLYVACEGMKAGDIVLSGRPGKGYSYGTVAGPYEYFPGTNLPHRRRVDWHGVVPRGDMSPELAASAGTPSTVFSLSGHATELGRLTNPEPTTEPIVRAAVREEVNEKLAFQLEKQLEDFIVHNWSNTQLGRDYDIFEEDGELRGRQFMTDTGPMDILAVSKDRTRLLVIELKKGRTSDAVVGQIQRYMGFVHEELLEPGQSVEGIIIAGEDDIRITRALKVNSNIRFMKYRIEFHLES